MRWRFSIRATDSLVSKLRETIVLTSSESGREEELDATHLCSIILFVRSCYLVSSLLDYSPWWSNCCNGTFVIYLQLRKKEVQTHHIKIGYGIYHIHISNLDSDWIWDLPHLYPFSNLWYRFRYGSVRESSYPHPLKQEANRYGPYIGKIDTDKVKYGHKRGGGGN